MKLKSLFKKLNYVKLYKLRKISIQEQSDDVGLVLAIFASCITLSVTKRMKLN